MTKGNLFSEPMAYKPERWLPNGIGPSTIVRVCFSTSYLFLYKKQMKPRASTFYDNPYHLFAFDKRQKDASEAHGEN